MPQAHLMALCFCWRLGACIKEGNGIPNTLNTKSQQTKATFSKLVNQTVKPSEPTKEKYGQGCIFRNTAERTYEPRRKSSQMGDACLCHHFLHTYLQREKNKTVLSLYEGVI